jgi:hypothetical protein
MRGASQGGRVGWEIWVKLIDSLLVLGIVLGVR